MPLYALRQDSGFLCKFLCIVLAKVELGGRLLVEREDVVGGFEFGDCYKADLSRSVIV